MDTILKFLISILSIIVIISFFLPWISIEQAQSSKFSNLITGEKQNSFDIKGFDIPKIANSKNAHLIINIANLLKPGIKNIDKKSYLVWSIPLLALIILIITLGTIPSRWLNFLLGLIAITISCILIYKIKTTDFNKLVLQIKINRGLWYIIWAYLGIGILELLKPRRH